MLMLRDLPASIGAHSGCSKRHSLHCQLSVVSAHTMPLQGCEIAPTGAVLTTGCPGCLQEAIKVLSSMHKAGETADTVTYNLLIVSATRLNRLRTAVDVYKRWVAASVFSRQCVQHMCSSASAPPHHQLLQDLVCTGLAAVVMQELCSSLVTLSGILYAA